ncbi:MAG: SDR family NAD(P)-dependent oxidoreductase [Marinobacter sp.]|uniref:SDR family NAD(P)-dependent oxidoreductase n=1 Tax=Marinobacter sp. TaxID=50741 RepID=UPI00299EC235|nr:SDR family NAD(P)-dependent oxidoreductase [Marinobacter sp.]MDX1635385.1 SDR family NAD(P)-dependent oxidoreductase [Marinobacter sp.]
MDKVCAIIGIGPGNGEALVRRFCDEGYQVAMLTRSEDTLSDMEQRYGSATGFVCDVTDSDQIHKALGRIEDELGPVQTLVYNAGAGVFKTTEDSTEADFEHTWKVNTLGLAMAAKAVLPQLRKHDQANLMVTGASAAWRGRANTAPFASAKAAQRSLAQSLARQLGPENIHVGYLVIDGVIDLPRTRKMLPDKQDDFFIQADAVADAVWALCQQHRSGWTFELDLRPFGESW